jgi:hypothetical protein
MNDAVPNVLHCPVCDGSGPPAAQAGPVAICSQCGASLAVAADGTCVSATARETTQLTAAELLWLQKARGGIARKAR